MESNSALKVKNKKSSNLLTAFSTWRELGIVAVTLLLMGAITLRSPYFLNIANFEDSLVAISLTVIVACGQMLAIIIRGIDLSVSSIVGLVAMVVGLFIRDKFEFPMGLTLVMGIGMGFFLGLINGLFITF